MCIAEASGRAAYSESGGVTSRSVNRFLSFGQGAWAPGGDYLPEGDRRLMSKPEVHRAEWSVT
jgi:hypothetical protein